MSTNNDRPFEKGELIEYADVHYEVVENFGDTGIVKYHNDDSGEKFSFYWGFHGGEECKRINT